MKSMGISIAIVNKSNWIDQNISNEKQLNQEVKNINTEIKSSK
jgi:hypothetical protein